MIVKILEISSMDLSGQTLIIRADGNTRIGSGHVMRCLALAQGWQDKGGRIVLLMGEESASLSERWRREGMEAEVIPAHPGSGKDAMETADFAKGNGANWIVVDGYQFDAGYQRIIKETGLKLLFVDDYGHADHYYADIVLNQNIQAHEGLYKKREPYTRLLLGTDYVLLRGEFLKWREYRREIPEVAKKILITMGGSDPDNCTLKVSEALFLLQLKDICVIAVVGGNNPHYETLKSRINGAPSPIVLERNVTNMPELMAWADVAISAGGSTVWEILFMGLPNLTIIVAENQRDSVEKLELYNATVNLGSKDDLNPDRISREVERLCRDRAGRVKMLDGNRSLVDGGGVERVLSALYTYDPGKSRNGDIEIRKAVFADAYQIWRLANSRTVRENAFNSKAIPLDEHIKWYRYKLSSSDCIIRVLEYNSVLSAIIRYDRINKSYIEIDFAVIDSLRGKGLGTEILKSTMAIAVQDLSVDCLRGTVLKKNGPSQKSFLKAGFKKVSESNIHGHDCYIFEWKL